MPVHANLQKPVEPPIESVSIDTRKARTHDDVYRLSIRRDGFVRVGKACNEHGASTIGGYRGSFNPEELLEFARLILEMYGAF